MAINNAFTIFDGIVPSWADLRVSLTPDGASLLDTRDVAEINTNTIVTVGQQGGVTGGRLLARTTGEKKDEASWTLYHSGYQKIIRAFKEIAPQRGNQRIVGLVHFHVQYLWSPPTGTDIFETQLRGVRMLGRELNSAEGPDPNKVKVPLSVAEIVDVVDGEEIVFL